MFDIVLLHPEFFRPYGWPMQFFERSFSPKEGVAYVSEGRLWIKSDSEADILFPPFSHVTSRPPWDLVNPFLLSLNADLKFRYHQKTLGFDGLPAESRILVEKTMELADLIYFQARPNRETAGEREDIAQSLAAATQRQADSTQRERTLKEFVRNRRIQPARRAVNSGEGSRGGSVECAIEYEDDADEDEGADDDAKLYDLIQSGTLTSEQYGDAMRMILGPNGIYKFLSCPRFYVAHSELAFMTPPSMPGIPDPPSVFERIVSDS